jgi:hypothetical protein
MTVLRIHNNCELMGILNFKIDTDVDTDPHPHLFLLWIGSNWFFERLLSWMYMKMNAHGNDIRWFWMYMVMNVHGNIMNVHSYEHIMTWTSGCSLFVKLRKLYSLRLEYVEKNQWNKTFSHIVLHSVRILLQVSKKY